LVSKADDLLFHGNRGGGKTDLLLADFCRDVNKGFGAEWRGILFRQTFPQLEEVVIKSHLWFNKWFPGAKWNASKYMWRFPNGRIVRFRTVERKVFSSAFIEGLVAAAGTNTVTLDASIAGVAERYVGWTVEIGGEKRKIMTNTVGRLCTLNKAWSTAPTAGDAYDLYKNFSLFWIVLLLMSSEHIALDPTDQILSVLRVIDMDSGSVLQRANRTANFESGTLASGIPSVFQDREDGIFF